jgi:hypothetical protein
LADTSAGDTYFVDNEYLEVWVDGTLAWKWATSTGTHVSYTDILPDTGDSYYLGDAGGQTWKGVVTETVYISDVSTSIQQESDGSISFTDTVTGTKKLSELIPGTAIWDLTSNVITPSTGGDDVRLGSTEQLQFVDTTSYIYGPSSGLVRIVANNSDVIDFNSSGNVIIYNTLLPDSSTGSDIGSSSLWWSNIYGERLYLDSVNVYIEADSAGNMVFADNVISQGTVSLSELIGGTAGFVNVSGTPSDNDIAVFTDSNTVEGDNNFQWTGSQLSVKSASSQIRLTDTTDSEAWDLNADGGVLTIHNVNDGVAALQVGSNNTTTIAYISSDQLRVSTTLEADTIQEYTGSAGVTIEGVQLVDNDVVIPATDRLYLDGSPTGGTFIYESSDNVISLVSDNNVVAEFSNSEIAVHETIRPTSNYNLGTTGNFFVNLYVDQIYVDDVNTYIALESDTQMSFTDAVNGTVKLGDLTGQMVYPGAGLAKSTGSAWDTSVTDNSSNWNDAYTHSQIAGGDSVHVSTTENTQWDAAYTHSQIAGGDSVHVSTTENTQWDTAYSHSQVTTGNPHSIGYADISDFNTGVSTYETSHSDVVVDGDFSANGILRRTGAGAYGSLTGSGTVDTVETSVTDDDTHLPTSGAIVDYCSSFITGNETITLTGDVTGSGTTSIATTIEANAVHGTMLNTDAITDQTALTSGLASNDELMVSDSGVLKRMDISVVQTYMQDNLAFTTIANETDNRVLTSTGSAEGANAEANLTFDGSTLTVTGALTVTNLTEGTSGDYIMAYDTGAGVVTYDNDILITGTPSGIRFATQSGFVQWSDADVEIAVSAGELTFKDDVTSSKTLAELVAAGGDVTASGTLTDNVVMVGAGSSTISVPDANVSFNNHSIWYVDNITLNAGYSLRTSGASSDIGQSSQFFDSAYIDTYYVNATANYINGTTNTMAFYSNSAIAMTLTSSSNVQVHNTLHPDSATGSDLGTASLWWSNVYMDGNLYFDATTEYIYAPGGNIINIVTNSTIALQLADTVNVSYNTLRPTDVKSQDLGTSTYWWDNCYVDRLYIDNTNTYIDISGSDMTFTSSTAGTVALNAILHNDGDGANNRVATYTDTEGVHGEANLTFDGDNLFVGTLTSEPNESTHELIVGSSTAGETGGISLAGSQATDTIVSQVLFHNAVAGDSADRIARIAAYRDADNDAGKLVFHVWNDSATGSQAMTLKQDSILLLVDNSTTNAVWLDATSFRPYTDNANQLGDSTYGWDEVYANISSGGTSNHIDWNSDGQFTYEADASDIRIKENVKRIENAYDKIDKIHGYTFQFKQEAIDTMGKKPGDHAGLIAQELQEVLPEAVGENDFGYLYIDYEEVTPLLLEAIKDQKKEIDNLHSELHQLRKQVETLINKFN